MSTNRKKTFCQRIIFIIPDSDSDLIPDVRVSQISIVFTSTDSCP